MAKPYANARHFASVLAVCLPVIALFAAFWVATPN